jgi:hypothetical protein
MTRNRDQVSMSVEDVYAAVNAVLRARSADLIQHIEAKVSDFDGQSERNAGNGREGRVAAIAATVNYSLAAIDRRGKWDPIPQALAEHVHHLARIGVRAGVLVRRCIVVRRGFETFIQQEIERAGYADSGAMFKRLYEMYRPLWEHIIVSVEHEHEEECERLSASPERRRSELVRQLLRDDLPLGEQDVLKYEVSLSWHLGVLATGSDRAGLLLALNDGLCRPFLYIPDADNGTSWAWFGGTGKLGASDIGRLLSMKRDREASLAIGESGFGLAGWRETHEEAQAALLVAERESGVIVSCANALPIIGALQSQAVIKMFHKTYIAPLNSAYLDGRRVRDALRAYFKHGRSPSTAGRAIGVSRRTIENYLNDTRKILGDPVDLTGLEIALRIEDLGYMDGSDHSC